MVKRGPQNGRMQKGIDWDKVKGLGRIHDNKLAERMGVSSNVVMHARRARGIPAKGKVPNLDDIRIADKVLTKDVKNQKRRHRILKSMFTPYLVDQYINARKLARKRKETSNGRSK